METRSSRPFPVLYSLLLVVVFGLGILVGATLVPRWTSAAAGTSTQAAGCGMSMDAAATDAPGGPAAASGKCPMMGGAEQSASDSAAGKKGATDTDAGSMKMGASGSCPMMKGDGKSAAASGQSAKETDAAVNTETTKACPMMKTDGKASEAKPSAWVAAGKQAAAVYTCPMHPEVQSSKPGQCPKCGMALVQKKS